MQFRSINRRTVAALASTAVVAGALVVPTLLAAPAQATTVEDQAFTCTFGGNDFAYPTDVALTAAWDKATGRAKLSAELDNMPNPAPPMVIPNQVQVSKLSVKVDGATAVTNLSGTTTATFQGGTPIDIPTVSGLASAKGESLSVVVTAFELTAGSFVIPCTLAAPSSAAVVPITFPTGSDLNYVCTFGANKFGYLTDATVSAVDLGSTLKVKVELENMPNTAPVFISFPNATHASTLAVAVNGGSSVNAVGNSVANFTGGTPVAIPPMTVDVASTATSAAVVANSFKLVVNGSTEIPCALAAPVALPAVTATIAGPSAECTKAKGDVTAAQAAVKTAETKVKADQAKVKKTQAKVKKAKAKVKKAKKAAKAKKAKAKKQLKAAQKALKAAKSTLTADTKKHSTAKTALTSANTAVTAAC